MYAVIETGGKQYKVAEGDEIFVEKLEAESGAKVELKVLMLVADDGAVTTGDVKATATAEVLGVVKGAKVIVYKYKAKKNVRKKNGHRQRYTKLKIEKIG